MGLLHLLVLTICVGFSLEQMAIGVGSGCTVQKLGVTGKCRNIENCDFFKQYYENGHLTPEASNIIRPYRCGQGTLIVCCPTGAAPTQNPRPLTSTTATTKAVPRTTPAPLNLMLPLERYQNVLPTPRNGCGNTSATSDRIHGGQEANLKGYPWTGLLEYSKPNNIIGTHCGGTLITNRYFLTAAHCIAGKNIPRTWRVSGVRLGEWDTSTDIDCEDDNPKVCNEEVVSIPVEELIVHESFDNEASNNPNDIALIRLKHIVPNSPTITPACLPFGDDFAQLNYAGRLMEIVGWGRTENGRPSNRKLVADVKVVDWHKCRNKFQSQGVTVLDHHMCAGGDEGIDSCNGDSGGGLFLAEKGEFYTIGIISFGTTPCAQKDWPGVYTRVDHYIDWIVQKIRIE